jgi:adenosylcobinamide kinase/adenosylcobinamide-phosphate guanylyltransferase
VDGKKITLITGGMRSGKSRHALALTDKIHGPKIFVATARAFDAAMSLRIKKHQEERGGEYVTIEEPVRLAETLHSAPPGCAVVLIDCLTLWVNNLLYYYQDAPDEIRRQFNAFLGVLAAPPTQTVIVTNEVGLGVTPDNPLTRTFIDELGFINQKVAQLSDEVILMVAGLPQSIKRVNRHGTMDNLFSSHTADG